MVMILMFVYDHCKRKGFTKAICFRSVGYPPNFERRSENLTNQQSDKGNYQRERGGSNYHIEISSNFHNSHLSAHHISSTRPLRVYRL